MAEPFKGFYDFWGAGTEIKISGCHFGFYAFLGDLLIASQGNQTKKPLSAQSFLGILEDLEVISHFDEAVAVGFCWFLLAFRALCQDAFPMPENGEGLVDFAEFGDAFWCVPQVMQLLKEKEHAKKPRKGKEADAMDHPTDLLS